MLLSGLSGSRKSTGSLWSCQVHSYILLKLYLVTLATSMPFVGTVNMHVVAFGTASKHAAALLIPNSTVAAVQY